MQQVKLSWNRAQTAVPICCVCGEVRDGSRGAIWETLEAHLEKHGYRRDEVRYIHTFCPSCFMQYEDLLGLGHRNPNLWKS